MEPDEAPAFHPYWLYLNYTDMVFWNERTAGFFVQHHNAGTAHVVGCLRSGFAPTKEEALISVPSEVQRAVSRYKIISAFDSTYTLKATTPGEAGLAFARHMLQLVECFEDAYLVFKCKKHPDFLFATGNSELALFYEQMGRHPRVLMADDSVSPGPLISLSALTVSFPFTSTTYEAISDGLPAIWHDPASSYKNVPYAKYPELVTHGFPILEELTGRRLAECGTPFSSPLPQGAPEFDPYRDGKAIERFRGLLAKPTA